VPFEVLYAGRARKDLENMDPVERSRVDRAIRQYAGTGHGDVKKLVDTPGVFRLRAGKWRAMFLLEAKGTVLRVVRIENRGEAY